MRQRELDILRGKLIPQVKQAEFTDDLCVLCNEVRMFVPVGAVELVQNLAMQYWGIHPIVAESNPHSMDESYEIRIEAGTLYIHGNARYAMQTLRQLAEPERGVRTHTRYILQQGRIMDSPALKFRGMHLCCFPETPLWEVEKQLRLAAYYKFSYVVIEPWGTFPYESHPELVWKDSIIHRKEWARLIDLAYQLGVQPIPQFNLLGHATASRVSSGKHAVLDFNPSLQSLFEPDGWTWCISNPETIALQEDVVRELYEFFRHPPFFHIGYDEAYSFATCANCRGKNLEELVYSHISHFNSILTGLGSKAIMWHDMLFQWGDPRWKHCIVCGQSSDELSNLYTRLPKDIVIADWQYSEPADLPENEQWATSRFLKREGFDVLVCPWHRISGTQSLGKLAEMESLTGMLATTWDKNYGNYLHSIFYGAGQAAWAGGSYSLNPPGSLINHHLRQVGWDMGVTMYEQTGTTKLQVSPATFQS